MLLKVSMVNKFDLQAIGVVTELNYRAADGSEFSKVTIAWQRVIKFVA